LGSLEFLMYLDHSNMTLAVTDALHVLYHVLLLSQLGMSQSVPIFHRIELDLCF